MSILLICKLPKDIVDVINDHLILLRLKDVVRKWGTELLSSYSLNENLELLKGFLTWPELLSISSYDIINIISIIPQSKITRIRAAILDWLEYDEWMNEYNGGPGVVYEERNRLKIRDAIDAA